MKQRLLLFPLLIAVASVPFFASKRPYITKDMVEKIEVGMSELSVLEIVGSTPDERLDLTQIPSRPELGVQLVWYGKARTLCVDFDEKHVVRWKTLLGLLSPSLVSRLMERIGWFFGPERL